VVTTAKIVRGLGLTDGASAPDGAGQWGRHDAPGDRGVAADRARADDRSAHDRAEHDGPTRGDGAQQGGAR
jgi:hypothetical protein